MGIIRLGERYGKDRLNNACKRALKFGALRYRYIKSILEQQLDQAEDKASQMIINPINHENIRGGNYYNTQEEQTNVDS